MLGGDSQVCGFASSWQRPGREPEVPFIRSGPTESGKTKAAIQDRAAAPLRPDC